MDTEAGCREVAWAADALRDAAAFLGARGLTAFFDACGVLAFFAAAALGAFFAVDAFAARFAAADFAGAAFDLAFFAADLCALLAAALRNGNAGAFFFAGVALVALAAWLAFLSLRLAAPCFELAMSLALDSCGDATACYSVVVPHGQPISLPARRRHSSFGPHALTRVLLFLIAVYKRLLSPLLGARCRFHPSCSTYACVAIARFGPWRGSVLAAWRILRCQPLCEGGFDPVPESFTLRRRRRGERSE